MEHSYPRNLFVVKKLFKVYLNLISLKISPFLHFIAESIKLIKEITFYRWISMYYVFPTRASVFLTLLTKFGGKKMRSSRRERCFYSNYFIPKCYYIEESFFHIALQSNKRSCCFCFLLSLSSFLSLIFSSFSYWRLPIFASQKLGCRV